MTIIKVLVEDIDPMLFNSLRAAIAVTISIPFIIMALRKINKRNLTYAIAAGLCMAVATSSAIYALTFVQASYVIILSLLSPVVFVILSNKLMHEKINARSAAGVSVAAIGALLAVSLPLLLGGETSMEFSPIATTLVLISCFFFPLGLIFYRKAHESGMPFPAIQGISSSVILVISFTTMYVTVGIPLEQLNGLPVSAWIGILYSAIVVIFIARIMSMASLERIGASAYSTISYLENIIAIIIPVLFLGEKLSVAVIVGGMLILVGVYLTEHHRSKHHPHIRTLAQHNH